MPFFSAIKSFAASVQGQFMLVIFLAILPMIGLTVYTDIASNQILKIDAQNSILRVANLSAIEQQRLIDAGGQILLALSHVPEINSKECGKFLSDTIAEFPAYSTIFVLDSRGTLQCLSGSYSGNPDFSGRSYFERAVQTKKLAIGDYQLGRISGKYILPVALPILDASGNVKKVIALGIDITWVGKIAQSANLQNGTTITVIDHNSTIIGRYPDAGSFIGKPYSAPILAEIITGKASSGIAEGIGLMGQDVVVGFADIGGGHIIVSTPSAIVLAETRTIFMRNLLLVLIFGLLTLAMTRIFAQYLILSKIKRIVAAADAFSSGDLTVRTNVDYSGELGTIAKSFDLMSARLAETIVALDKKIKEQGSSIAEIEQKKEIAEKERARAEIFLAAIGDGVIVTDGQARIVFMNESAENLLHTKMADQVGKEIYNLRLEDEAGDEIPRTARPAYHALVEGARIYPDPTKTIYFRRDDKRIPLFITASPIGSKGVLGEISVFHDVSQEKEIDKTKSEFVSLAAHQLRTPLSTISWYAEVLLGSDLGKLNEKQRQYMEEIYHSDQRLIALINAMLDVSRLELGTLAINTAPVDLHVLADGVVKEYDRVAKKKHVMIHASYEPRLPKLSADERLMRIIIENLLHNAIKYSDKNSKVELKVSMRESQFCIEVKDHGVGIPKAQQPKIFTKLFRADNARLIDPDGTGLGLYIVKSILDVTGGTISFTSEEGKGSTFSVCIPETGMRGKAGTTSLIEADIEGIKTAQ
jgi:signal transduction histidine kinase/HAMP domain-containing protein